MLRVGSVPYLVGRPLDLGLADEPGIRFHNAVPARLVRGLRDGSVDVALVSSIELFRQPGYGYLEGIAVAGHGYVGSVQVFLRRPLEEVRTVALDPASRTAQALTQVVWPEGLARPRFLEVPEGVDPRQTDADAWLRIGDVALSELAEDEGRPLLNPSARFRELTDLPFVFAPWIVRPGVDVTPHLPAFRRAQRRGTARIQELVEASASAAGYPTEFLRRYLEDECLYTPGETMRPSLLAFRDRAAALGLARAELEPRAIPLDDGGTSA